MRFADKAAAKCFADDLDITSAIGSRMAAQCVDKEPCCDHDDVLLFPEILSTNILLACLSRIVFALLSVLH